MGKKEVDPGFARNAKVIVGLVVVGIVAVVGVVSFMSSKTKPALPDSQVVQAGPEGAAPERTTENPKFNALVEQQNKARAADARSGGESFVPTFPSKAPDAAKAGPDGLALLDQGRDDPLTRSERIAREREREEAREAEVARAREARALQESERATAASQQAQVLAVRWGFAGAQSGGGQAPRGISVIEPQQPKVISVAASPSVASPSPSAASGTGTTRSSGRSKTLTAAGEEIFPAVIEPALDTDNPARVLGMITGGKLMGARLIGTAKRSGETINVDFEKMAFRGKSYSISAFAVDQDSMRSAIAGDVDRKVMQRYGIPMLAAAIQAWANAKAQTGSTDTLSIAGVSTSRPPPTSTQVGAAAVSAGAATVVQNLQKEQFETRVQTPGNFPIGVVFGADVVEAN